MKELEIADLEKLAAKYPKNSTLYLGRIEQLRSDKQMLLQGENENTHTLKSAITLIENAIKQAKKVIDTSASRSATGSPQE